MGRQGTSLIELMVGVAIVSILGLAFMAISDVAATQRRRSEQNLKLADLKQEISSLLSSESSCSQVVVPNQNFAFSLADDALPIDLAQLNSSGMNLSLRLPGGDTLPDANQVLSYFDLKVPLLRIFNARDLGGGRFAAMVVGQFSSVEPAGDYGPFALGQVTFELNASNQLVRCYGKSGEDMRIACASLGGTWNSTTSMCEGPSGPNLSGSSCPCTFGNAIISGCTPDQLYPNGTVINRIRYCPDGTVAGNTAIVCVWGFFRPVDGNHGQKCSG